MFIDIIIPSFHTSNKLFICKMGGKLSCTRNTSASIPTRNQPHESISIDNIHDHGLSIDTEHCMNIKSKFVSKSYDFNMSPDRCSNQVRFLSSPPQYKVYFNSEET